MIWVPLPGRGPLDGYRYRDTLGALADRELLESHDDALGRIEALSQTPPRVRLGEWFGHGPALSVYLQWAIYALRDRDLITEAETGRRLQEVARMQQADGRYPGIHYGRSAGWLAPAWWGSDIHAQHRTELISLSPQHYSEESFARHAAGGS